MESYLGGAGVDGKQLTRGKGGAKEFLPEKNKSIYLSIISN